MFRLLQNTTNYMVSFLKKMQRKSDSSAPVDAMVKKFSHVNPDNPKRALVKTGRPWLAEQLRLKSSEDLHKLYYVCLKQRNTILSDQALRRKLQGRSGEWNSLRKLKITVARLLTVLSERQKVKRQYKAKLQKEYIDKKRQELIQATKDLNDVQIPAITWRLMKQKQRDLRKGIDNTNYIERQLKYDKEKREAKQNMLQNIEKLPQSFESFFKIQMQQNNYKPSQQEILRSHVKNWRMLSLYQRRVVLGHVNARRARDARTQFLKQLKTLGKKLKHEYKN